MAGSEDTMGKTQGHGARQPQCFKCISTISPTPQRYLLSHQLLRLYAYIVTTTNSVLLLYIDTAPIASLWSILLQHPLRLPAPYYYSNYYVFMIYLVTETITSLGSIWSQQLLHLMIYIVTAPITSSWSTVTATITSLWSILVQQPSHLCELYSYSHSYDLMIYSVPATKPPSRSIVLQPIYYVPTI